MTKIAQKHGWALTPFPPGTSGNAKGRPKKLFTRMLDELKENMGGGAPSAQDIHDLYRFVLGLTQPQLLAIVNDTKGKWPHSFRVLAKNLLTRRDFETMEAMLDRAFGKPKISMEGSVMPINNISLTLISNGRQPAKHTHIDSVPAQLSEQEEN